MELNQDARAVLDAMREGINIIDAEGRIIFGNKAYLDFLSKETGIGIGSIEGQYLRDLRPGARLPEVLATGKPILHAPRMEKQHVPYFPGRRNGGGLVRGHLSQGCLCLSN